MLSQVNYWAQVAGTVVDVLLLARILSLRLQKTYLFITLACTLTIFFDLAALWFGLESVETQRIFIFSRFLYVFVFPIVVWDVFEEMKDRLGKVRRLAMIRLISGLLFTTILSLILVSFMGGDDPSGETSFVTTLAVILWAGSTTASLAFMITIHRALKSQAIGLPHNTEVWLRYWEMAIACEVLTCFWLILMPLLKSETITESLGLGFVIFTIAITVWCIFRLKRIPSEEAGSAVEKEKA